MALSEREQRMLDEMERHLYQSEADVLRTESASVRRPNYRAIVIGVVIAVIGLAAILAGVILDQIIVGILGFVAMLAGVLFIFSPRQAASAQSAGSASPGESSKRSQSTGSRKSSSSFMDRIEQRWQQRGDGER